MRDRAVPGRDVLMMFGWRGVRLLPAGDEGHVTAPDSYVFSDIRVDLRRVIVTRGGEAVPLEPKSFDVLVFLIEHRDRLVGKEELLDAVWKDTFVTPNVLTRAVAQIRRALDDDAYKARYIETAAKRGYRFIGEVRAGAGGAAASAPEAAPSAPLVGSRRVVPRWLAPAGAVAAVVVLAAAWLAWRPAADPSRPFVRSEPRQLTTRTGDNRTPAISGDGHRVAYASDRTGHLEIYVAGLSAGSGEIPVTSDGGENVQPAWSPDGQWLAYHSQTRGGIWIVPSTGGTARQIVEFGSQPAWSPDGQRLAFTSDAGGMASQSTIWTVDRDGTDRRPLTKLGNPAGGHRAPAWSHDGRYVAFSVSFGGNVNTIAVIATNDGAVRSAASAGNADAVQFSPDDRSIYWAGSGIKNRPGLWRRPFDEGRLDGASEEVAPFEGGAIEGLSIAQSGATVFSFVRDDSNLWTVEVPPTGEPGVPRPLTRDSVRNTHPAYSPDGRVAFMQMVAGRPVSTWLAHEDGSHEEALLGDLAAGDPQWSRDGRLLAIIGGPESETAVFSWVDLATRRTTPVPLRVGDIRSARLSPDGRRIAFHVIDPGGAVNVWTAPLDGGPRRRVTQDAEAVSYPAWSPDGQWLAVEIKRGDQTSVGVVPSGGGAVEPLTFDRGQSWPRSFSPDGEWIAFAGQRDGIWNVWAVSRRTKVTRQLTRFASASGYVRYPDWSPRGGRIVFERNQRLGSVWLLDLK